MTDHEQLRQTTVNVQEKAALIWSIADKLRDVYKPHEYGNVILPMCVLKRFDDTLADTKEAVLARNATLDNIAPNLRPIHLRKAAGHAFYNTSPFTFRKLLGDSDNIKANFNSYISGFSENVRDVIKCMDFDREIQKMDETGLLYSVVKDFCSDNGYLGSDRVKSEDMGYIFEELVRRFSESYNEQAGAHFTARDIIWLMADLLVGDNEGKMREKGVVASIYDMAMGTSQMLSCLTDRLRVLDPNAEVTSYGQEINSQTYAIAKADSLIRGQNAGNMKLGDTLANDQFKTYRFDYVISNPPFGVEWKISRPKVEEEHNLGAGGRFPTELPGISDGQMLFLLNGVAKLKEKGRMAIIQNGSPLFNGDAGSGESDIRGYFLEHDWLEAIVQLPGDLFYNTGIATYIWVVTKNKSAERKGKVQLINASECYEKRRKSLGSKRVDITEKCRNLIMTAYHDGGNREFWDENHTIRVESKTFPNDYFKYSKLTICRPLRLSYVNLSMPKSGFLKDTERQLLQSVVDTYNDRAKEKSLSDEELFRMLRENGVKTTAQQVKLIRKWLGKKDQEAPEVHVKPCAGKDDTNYEWDSELTDTEVIPCLTDTDEYLEQNVKPYAPDYHVDDKKTRTGYEIPFTREFYKYTAPRNSEDICATLKELERQGNELMSKIFE